MRNGPEREAMFLRPLVAVKRIVEDYAREHGMSLNTAASALIVDGAKSHGIDTSTVDVSALVGESS